MYAGMLCAKYTVQACYCTREHLWKLYFNRQKELGGIKKTIDSNQYSKTYLFIENTYYGKCMIMCTVRYV